MSGSVTIRASTKSTNGPDFPATFRTTISWLPKGSSIRSLLTSIASLNWTTRIVSIFGKEFHCHYLRRADDDARALAETALVPGGGSGAVLPQTISHRTGRIRV